MADERKNIKLLHKARAGCDSYLVFRVDGDQVYGSGYHSAGTGFFYVRTNDDGTLYIDNFLAASTSLANQENALDTSVQSLIGQFESESGCGGAAE